MKELTKVIKYATLSLLILLASAMLLLSAYAQEEIPEEIPPEQYPQVPNPYNPPSPPPAPQEVAIVVVSASVGGTTDPAPGAYKYPYAETITLKATASSGFKFLYWTIRGTYTPAHNVPPINYPENINPEDPGSWIPAFPAPSEVAQDSLITSTNPLTIICGYGYTYVYEPVFAPTTAPPSTSDAIVVILESVGGTTDPAPGIYHYVNGSTISLKATANSGYEFVYWVAVDEQGHPTTISDNPTNIICGYGYTFKYQAMFQPAGAGPPVSAEVPIYIWAIIAVLAIVAVVAIAFAVTRGKK
jgi:hypothetical protein